MKPLEKLLRDRNEAAEKVITERQRVDLDRLLGGEERGTLASSLPVKQSTHAYDNANLIHFIEARDHGVADIASAVDREIMDLAQLPLVEQDKEQYAQALLDLLSDQDRLLRSLGEQFDE